MPQRLGPVMGPIKLPKQTLPNIDPQTLEGLEDNVHYKLWGLCELFPLKVGCYFSYFCLCAYSFGAHHAGRISTWGEKPSEKTRDGANR